MQMTMFFFLPSMLLSGSCSRSAACPVGAGPRRIFPLTHFLRIVRGIMLKGSEFADRSRTCGRSR
jgi:ABC-2 type transport system permease protein